MKLILTPNSSSHLKKKAKENKKDKREYEERNQISADKEEETFAEWIIQREKMTTS